MASTSALSGSSNNEKRERQEDLEYDLICQSYMGHLPSVRRFVEEHRVNVNCVDPDDGRTALMTASQNGQTQVVRYLIENKANVHAVDDSVLRGFW